MTAVKMKIEGMMCQHCEARVKNALESVSGVERAVVSHADGDAEVFCDDSVSKSALKQSVENAGYTVQGIN